MQLRKALMREVALVVALLFVTGLAVAQDAETIDHVTDDNVIVLQNGEAFESQDPASSTWMDNEDVLILDDGRMVNKDENEVVDVTPTTAPDEDDPDNE